MENIDKIYYINLDERTDRKEHILNQLININSIDVDKIQRIAAIKHYKGYIGCGLSQIIALQDAIEKKYKNILIFEDDFEFCVNENILNKKFEWFFNTYKDYKICLLSYNLFSGEKLDDNIMEIHEAQCASGYLINEKFMPVLLDSFSTAVNGLLRGCIQQTHSIDVEWKKLQGKSKGFLAFYPKFGKQLASWSNIENKFVDYGC